MSKLNSTDLQFLINGHSRNYSLEWLAVEIHNLKEKISNKEFQSFYFRMGEVSARMRLNAYFSRYANIQGIINQNSKKSFSIEIAGFVVKLKKIKPDSMHSFIIYGHYTERLKELTYYLETKERYGVVPDPAEFYQMIQNNNTSTLHNN